MSQSLADRIRQLRSNQSRNVRQQSVGSAEVQPVQPMEDQYQNRLVTSLDDNFSAIVATAVEFVLSKRFDSNEVNSYMKLISDLTNQAVCEKYDNRRIIGEFYNQPSTFSMLDSQVSTIERAKIGSSMVEKNVFIIKYSIAIYSIITLMYKAAFGQEIDIETYKNVYKSGCFKSFISACKKALNSKFDKTISDMCTRYSVESKRSIKQEVHKDFSPNSLMYFVIEAGNYRVVRFTKEGEDEKYEAVQYLYPELEVTYFVRNGKSFKEGSICSRLPITSVMSINVPLYTYTYTQVAKVESKRYVIVNKIDIMVAGFYSNIKNFDEIDDERCMILFIYFKCNNKTDNIIYPIYFANDNNSDLINGACKLESAEYNNYLESVKKKFNSVYSPYVTEYRMAKPLRFCDFKDTCDILTEIDQIAGDSDFRAAVEEERKQQQQSSGWGILGTIGTLIWDGTRHEVKDEQCIRSLYTLSSTYTGNYISKPYIYVEKGQKMRKVVKVGYGKDGKNLAERALYRLGSLKNIGTESRPIIKYKPAVKYGKNIKSSVVPSSIDAIPLIKLTYATKQGKEKVSVVYPFRLHENTDISKYTDYTSTTAVSYEYFTSIAEETVNAKKKRQDKLEHYIKLPQIYQSAKPCNRLISIYGFDGKRYKSKMGKDDSMDLTLASDFGMCYCYSKIRGDKLYDIVRAQKGEEVKEVKEIAYKVKQISSVNANPITCEVLSPSAYDVKIRNYISTKKHHKKHYQNKPFKRFQRDGSKKGDKSGSIGNGSSSAPKPQGQSGSIGNGRGGKAESASDL